jgi:molybdopterin-biosynthesis enzyme MoeA-like protein
MIDTKQPEALRLADELDCASREDAPVHTAADELRRLHEVNVELLEALKVLVANGGIGPEDMFDDARAAIAKAEVTK